MWLWKDVYLSFIIIIVYKLCVVCNCKGSLARRDKRSLSAPPWEEAIEFIREELEKVPIAQFEGDITLFQRVDAASHLTSYLLRNDNFSVVYERGTNDFGVEAIVLNPEEDKLPWKNQKRRFVGLRLKNTGDHLYYVVFAYLRYYDKVKDPHGVVEPVGGQWALEWDMWDYRGPGKNRFTNFGFSNCAPSAIVPCGYNSALDSENSLRPSGIKQRWMPMSRTLRNPSSTKLPAFALQSGFDVDANFEFYGDLEVTKDGHDHGGGRSVNKGSEGGGDSPTVKPQVPEWLSFYSTSYSANAHQKQQSLGWSGSKGRKRRGLEKKDNDKLKPIPAIPRMDDSPDASPIFGSRESMLRSGEEFLRRGRKEKSVTRGRDRDSDDSRSIERTRSRIGDDRRRKDSRESRRKIRVRTEDDVSSDRELSLARYLGPTSSRYELNAKDREQGSRLREIEVESDSPSGWKSSSRGRERVSVTKERERYSQREEGHDRMKYLEQEIDRSREDSSRSRVGYKSRDRDDMLDRDHDSGKYAKKKDGGLKHSSTREKDPLPSSPDFSSPHTTANIVQPNPSSMLNEEPPKLSKEALISNQSFPINEDTPKPPKSSQRLSTDEDVSHVPFQKDSVKPRPAEDVDTPKMLPNVNNGFASQPKTENAAQESSEDDASFDANSFSTRVQTMPDDTFKVLTPQAKSRGIKPKTDQQQKWKPKKYGLEEEGTFFALGWKTQYMSPHTPNVTFRYEDDPFNGMGSCPHRAVMKSELDDASGHAKSVINIYTSLLRNYCLGFGETLKALVDHEVLRSSNTLFLLNLTSAHIKRRKLTAVRLEELELAFELYLFSTQLNELSNKEPESKGPDKSPITRSVHFLSNIILRGVDWARGPGRVHLVHLTRHLIIVTKVTYTKLLQDFDFLEPCTQCVADKELNYNDRIEVMALLEFLINGLAPVDNGDMAEQAFVNFFSLNLKAIQAHVSVLVN